MKNVLKKTGAIILLVAGTFSSLSFLIATLLQAIVKEAVDAAMFILLLGIPLIIGNAALWDWSKKKYDFWDYLYCDRRASCINGIHLLCDA